MAHSFSQVVNPTAISAIGQAIHTALTAAGWTLAAVNTKAIGTGTSSNPKWDSSFVTLTSAGVAIYQMPLAGLTNRWYVSVELDWRNSATQGWRLRLNSGTGVDVANVALTGAGTAMGQQAQNPTTNTWYVVANDYGLAVLSNASADFMVGVERARSADGAWTDDLLSWIVANGGTSELVGVSTVGSYNRARNWTSGEYAVQPLGFVTGWAGFNATAATSMPSTYSSSDGNIGFPAGMLRTSNGLGGVITLAQVWLNGDNVQSVDQTIVVNGTPRLYFAVPRALTPGGQTILLARS